MDFICFFVIFFILTEVHLLKINTLFAFYYFVLFIYTIFTQLGYLYFPEMTSAVSAGQYYGPNLFYKYWAFVFLSFLAIYIFSIIILNKQIRGLIRVYLRPVRFTFDSNRSSVGEIIFISIILCVETYLAFQLFKNYSLLSYYNQGILKQNKLWFYSFYINGLITFLLFIKFRLASGLIKKTVYFSLFVISVSISLLTSIRTGQRIELACLLFAFIGYSIPKRLSFFSRKSFSVMLCIIPIFLIMVAMGQSIRSIRGHSETFGSFLNAVSSLDSYVNFFKIIIFQDYLAPSLTLFTSIYYEIISPSLVLKSNLTCLVPLIHHITLGGIFARIVDPLGSAGYGYYILTEGYNVLGFCGIIYNVLVFVFGFKLLIDIFCHSNDDNFNRYMRGVVAFLAISIVRGQSMVFIKSIYFLILPAIILYGLAFSKRFCLVKSCKKINRGKVT